jgi:hypothetical protein
MASVPTSAAMAPPRTELTTMTMLAIVNRYEQRLWRTPWGPGDGVVGLEVGGSDADVEGFRLEHPELHLVLPRAVSAMPGGAALPVRDVGMCLP